MHTRAAVCVLALLAGHATGMLYPDASTDGLDAVKSWASGLPKQGEDAFRAKFGQKQRYGSPDHWGGGGVYQIFVDRFNNGNGANDNANKPQMQKDEEASGDLYNVHAYRHGGDLKGITDRLDYIKDLGMTQLWITPIFLNKNGDYHGYCVSDFLKIDPGFGTLEEMQELVAAAHDRGIRVILDVVVNHMCDPNTRYQNTPRGHDHYECSDILSGRNWNGVGGGSVAGQGWLALAADHFGPFKTNYFFNRCGPNSYADMTGTGNAAIYGDFVDGMFDFDTGNHDFQYIFTQIHKYWIAATDVDGFRLDAVKHVTEQFVTYFSPHIRAYAHGLGKDNFYLVGEVAGSSEWAGRFLGKQYSDPSNPDNKGHLPQSATSRMWEVKDLYLGHPHAKYAGLNAVYDFAHSGTAREVFRFEKNPFELEQYYYGTGHVTLAEQADDAELWNNLAIHDWPRFLDSDWLKNRWEVAASAQAYLALARGIPIVYYGEEQGFNGDCWHSRLSGVGAGADNILRTCSGHDHGLYRQTMWEGAGYNLGSALQEQHPYIRIGRSSPNPHSNWETDPVLNRNTALFKTLRKLYRIRSSCIALQRGLMTFRWVSRELVAFSRIFYEREAVVLINAGASHTTVPNLEVDGRVNAVDGQEYKNLLNGGQSAWTTMNNGRRQLTFNGLVLGPHSMAVFVHRASHGNYDEYLETHLCNA